MSNSDDIHNDFGPEKIILEIRSIHWYASGIMPQIMAKWMDEIAWIKPGLLPFPWHFRLFRVNANFENILALWSIHLSMSNISMNRQYH